MAQVTDVTVKKRILIQLSIPFFVLAGFVISAVIFGTLYFAGKLAGESSVQDPKFIASSIQSSVEIFLGETRKDVEKAAAALQSESITETDETDLRTILSGNSTLLVFGYFDENGNQIYELHKSRTEASLLNTTLNGDIHVALAKRNINGHVILSTSESGSTYFIWAYPRYDEEKNFIGALVAGIDASLIKSAVTGFSAVSPARVQIVDEGTVTPLIFADTLQGDIESFAPNENSLRAIFESDKNNYGYVLPGGSRIDGRWESISGTPWIVMAEVPSGGLPEGAGGLFVVSVAILIIFIILIFYYLYTVNRNVIRPLKKIEKTMHYFRTGDYSEPVKIDVQNEFIAIADQLNSMSKHIESNTSERVSQLKKALDRQNTDTRLLIEKDVELRDKGQKLKELDQAKSMFVSVAAHQMRTPLAAIKWAIKLVMDGDVGPVNAEQKEYLGKGYDSTTRMINLINDLLDVDKIESDKFSYVFREESLEDILQGIVNDLTPISNEKGVNLIYQKTSKEYPSISSDQVKLRNALQNLIDNAIKYTIGGGDVTVKLGLDKDILKLSISDTGIGIPISEQSKVFGKFFRAKNAIRQQTDGSGLGLFIVKKIIEKHNGKVEFESKEGMGTTFYISIPSKDAGGVAVADEPPASEVSSMKVAQKSPEKTKEIPKNNTEERDLQKNLSLDNREEKNVK